MNYQLLNTLSLEKSWSRNTLDVYKSNLKSILNKMDVKTFDAGQNTIIEEIDKLEKSSYVKSNYVNLFIIYRNTKELPNHELRKFRTKMGNEISVIKKENDTKTNLKMVDFPDYLTETERLAETFPTKYIIRRLLIHLGCRNRDVNLLFVFDKKIDIEIREKTIKEELNICHVRSKDIVITRRFYKTSTTYGILKNTIKDNKLMKIIKENYKNGDRLIPAKQSQNISRIVMNATRIGETELFKTQVKYYKNLGNLKKIKELSESRGTSLPTIIDNYDVDN